MGQSAFLAIGQSLTTLAVLIVLSQLLLKWRQNFWSLVISILSGTAAVSFFYADEMALVVMWVICAVVNATAFIVRDQSKENQ